MINQRNSKESTDALAKISMLPKICVSLTESQPSSLLQVAQKMAQSEADIVEWRLDYLIEEVELAELLDLLQQIRLILAKKDLLITLRTHFEGGSVQISQECYSQTYLGFLETGLIDWLDIEASLPESWFFDVLAKAQQEECRVIASYHNFSKMPSTSSLTNLVTAYAEFQPEMIKIAVMPNSEEEVWRLLHWNHVQAERLGQIKMTVIAMGELGRFSRLVGGITGSYLTFTSFSKEVAPGQLQFEEVNWLFKLARMTLQK